LSFPQRQKGALRHHGFHYQRGAEALNAGQGGKLLVIQLLESGQIARDDVQQIIGIAEQP